MSVVDAQRVKRELLLRSLFPSMPVAAQLRLVELLEEVELSPGELLFAPGEPPDRFVFLIEGRVALETEGLEPLVFSGFSVIGVVDAILERPRLRGCRALDPSKALMVRAADWFDLLEDNAEVARAVIRNFASQLDLLWREWAQRLPQQSEPPKSIEAPAFENYDKILALRQASFLRRAGMQAIASLAAVAEVVTLRAGEPLFELGRGGQDYFVVAAGLIDLSSAAGLHFTHDPGDLVGGPAVFCNSLGSYAAQARSDAIVLRIPQQEFYDQAEEHGRLLRGTLGYLATELEALQAVATTK